MTILEYRKKHKRCQYCKHLRIMPDIPSCFDTIYICKVSNNRVEFIDRLPRLCKCYEVKELNNNG